MSKRRKPKKSDQNNTEKAFQILRKAILEHPEIESTLWSGANWSLLINGYINNGVSYVEFCSELDGVKEFYKNRWDKSKEIL